MPNLQHDSWLWCSRQKLGRSVGPPRFLLGKFSPTAALPALTRFTKCFRKRAEVPPRPAPVLTILAGVVHQDDLLQEDGRGGVQDAVHGPQQCAPGFVVKHDDHAGGWQGGAPLEGLLNASVAKRGGRKKSTKI